MSTRVYELPAANYFPFLIQTHTGTQTKNEYLLRCVYGICCEFCYDYVKYFSYFVWKTLVTAAHDKHTNTRGIIIIIMPHII